MKIQTAELKYFKFHKDLTVDFDGKSLLIYGENGTGKSSIYEALYSNFYHQKRLDKNIASNIQETYRSRGCETENLEVNISFDAGKELNRITDELSDFNVMRVEKTGNQAFFNSIEPTIYFANEKVLNRLTKENFYIALNETLFEDFPQMKSPYAGADENHHFKRYAQFSNLDTLKKKIIDKIGNDDVDAVRTEFEDILKSENELLQFVFGHFFPTKEINKIIKKFDETFEISFVITPAQSGNSEVLEFNPPTIKIKIDDIEYDGKLSHHFNEAKLKLIGVAIYFALAKKYEAENGGFKLLVLDDFLTSLDMANRKLIMKYILEEFQDYQKLILTHNLQFFNMARKLINLDSEEANQWKVQKLFVHDHQAFLYDKDISYLTDAKGSLSTGDEYSAGNFIRKEFERIITEFEQLLELGRVEELQKIIDTLKSEDKHYIRSHKVTNRFYQSVQKILDDSTKNEQVKINCIKSSFNPLNKTEIEFTEKIQNADGTISNETIKALIKRGEFYKNFILNPTSHDDANAEIYKKECENAINILQFLNKIITNLKGTKYE
ncbi:AAA family ATPase [Sulfurimonas sp.]|uniref:ATP-binding protein n=1 Tax=Sulfurimonas sp. TaxID=2022749 RepID=UPI0025EC5E60|nr:AAA family ATPase [Sulfurimonas sp.]MCK9453998.1 hypothetical protein [Sulfurimonas sp.]